MIIMFKKLKRKFKRIPLEKRENQQSFKKMFQKANSSSLIGAPMSWILNIIITVPVAAWALDLGLDYIIVAAILWPPFYISSIIRQLFIDLAYAWYNINIDPSYLIRKLITKIKVKYFLKNKK